MNVFYRKHAMLRMSFSFFVNLIRACPLGLSWACRKGPGFPLQSFAFFKSKRISSPIPHANHRYPFYSSLLIGKYRAKFWIAYCRLTIVHLQTKFLNLKSPIIIQQSLVFLPKKSNHAQNRQHSITWFPAASCANGRRERSAFSPLV